MKIQMKFNRLFLVKILLLYSFLVAAKAGQVGQQELLAQGELLYNQCTGCHSLTENKFGPKHCNLIGRKSGSVENFNYSTAMKNMNISWNAETLNQFLKQPSAFVENTKMPYPGLKNNEERTALIDYLIQVTQSSVCQSQSN